MKKISLGLLLSVAFTPLPSAAAVQADLSQPDYGQIIGAVQINPTAVELILSDGHRMTVDFYNDNIFRLFRDDEGGIVRDPVAQPPAEILVRNPRRSVGSVDVNDSGKMIDITTPALTLSFDKNNGLMTVTDLRDGRMVVQQVAPVSFERGRTSLALSEAPDEYFYGGGVQNGRFSHKGRKIAIENQNSWTDGGVASPAPFYWSTGGYGVMFHTFGKGRYDFGSETPGTVTLTHDTPYLDMFVMVDDQPEELLADFYQLTGNPVLIPKFGFYEGHLNAYNRDYWVEDENGILFEDGKRYKESQRDNGGVKESLNGENNYQFSARAVIDRYAANDMPLGWVLPNDGYGAGYGQTETLDGNIQNLKSFGDYARSKGVEIGLWTQSDLHPKPDISALLQRDIVKEVRDAGVRVLKTDVAWVGWGYSFGLNGVADVGEIMPYYGNDARPFIISLDGWAGTQRYATIWSGDQTGGEWEYIRFHIPTYIGSGLSGQPNITSDMDGIFGGKNPAVNIRDFEWKTFTPMQLNMDGWGRNEKYPHALGEPASSINRMYLKMKSELLPYAYTYAREAVDGKPLIRAMFVDYPSAYTYGPATRYQYLYGPAFLVAPIYQATKADSLGNDIRNGIYLPEGRWIDYITGEAYDGGVVLNGFDAPIWKLPVFVKAGAIIPMVNANNNPSEIDRGRRVFEFFPEGKSELTVYDDDGVSMRYTVSPEDATVTTRVTSELFPKGRFEVHIDPSVGTYDGFDPIQSTELIINATARPQAVTATVGGRKIRLTEAASAEAARNGVNTYYYDAAPERNIYATPGSEFASVSIRRTPQLIVSIEKTDVNRSPVTVEVKGLVYEPGNNLLSSHGALSAPVARIDSAAIGAYEITPSWSPVAGADFYEIEFDGLNYTNIRDTELTFDGLRVETPYEFKLRAVNADGASDWTALSATTKRDPLEWAIRGVRGEADSEQQPGFGIARLFDFSESGDIFHTRYRKNGIPCQIIADLQSVNVLDHMDYLPRTDGGNGTWLKGNVAVSLDKIHWTEVDSFSWERNGEVKQFVFADQPQARYVRINVTDGVGNYATGRELYIFKVPGSESYIPGDINNDGKIDENDLMSYTNYTGLRTVDSDFDYVSAGDINRNGLIDSYDISVVATRLGDAGDDEEDEDATVRTIGGDVTVEIPKGVFAPGDTVSVIVRGDSLVAVNAVSFAVPYDASKWEFVGITQEATSGMENLTNDRMHTNGMKAVYPTLVNIGLKPTVEGDVTLFVLRFKALKRGSFDSKPTDIMIVDRLLNMRQF